MPKLWYTVSKTKLDAEAKRHIKSLSVAIFSGGDQSSTSGTLGQRQGCCPRCGRLGLTYDQIVGEDWLDIACVYCGYRVSRVRKCGRK